MQSFDLVIKIIMNRKVMACSSIYGQSTVEEKVPSEQLFISVQSSSFLFFFNKVELGVDLKRFVLLLIKEYSTTSFEEAYPAITFSSAKNVEHCSRISEARRIHLLLTSLTRGMPFFLRLPPSLMYIIQIESIFS